MLFFIISGCNLPFTILFFAAIASLLCSIIINSSVVEGEGLIKPSKFNQNFNKYVKSSTKMSKTLHNANLIYNKNMIDLSICQSDEDSEFCNVFANSDDGDFLNNNIMKPTISRHYICPPTSLEALRKRYGTRKSIWGEWTPAQTRNFYKSQLPKALQIDGSLGLTLEERAQLASASRHALRTYARERCHLPGRLIALLYDGIRHVYFFGSWSSAGMTWSEVQEKYRLVAKTVLGPQATSEEIALFVYRTIVEKSCSTNEFFDRMAYSEPIRNMAPEKLLNTLAGYKNILDFNYMKNEKLLSSLNQLHNSNMIQITNINEVNKSDIYMKDVLLCNNNVHIVREVNVLPSPSPPLLSIQDTTRGHEICDFLPLTAPSLVDSTDLNELELKLKTYIETNNHINNNNLNMISDISNTCKQFFQMNGILLSTSLTTSAACCMSMVYFMKSTTTNMFDAVNEIPFIPFMLQLVNH